MSRSRGSSTGIAIASFVLVFLLTEVRMNSIADENYSEGGQETLLDKIRNGFKYAKQYLGFNVISAHLAQFVTETFGSRSSASSQPKPNQQEQPSGPQAVLQTIVQLLGLKPPKLSAVALNAILFVAQLLASLLLKNNDSNIEPGSGYRRLKPGSPIEWIVKSPSAELQNLLTVARNEGLGDHIITNIENYSQDNEAACIQLLACKMSPFITRMQDVVFNGFRRTKRANNSNAQPSETHDDTPGGKPKIDIFGAESLFKYLPSRGVIIENSRDCIMKHDDCKIWDF